METIKARAAEGSSCWDGEGSETEAKIEWGCRFD